MLTVLWRWQEQSFSLHTHPPTHYFQSFLVKIQGVENVVLLNSFHTKKISSAVLMVMSHIKASLQYVASIIARQGLFLPDWLSNCITQSILRKPTRKRTRRRLIDKGRTGERNWPETLLNVLPSLVWPAQPKMELLYLARFSFETKMLFAFWLDFVVGLYQWKTYI